MFRRVLSHAVVGCTGLYSPRMVTCGCKIIACCTYNEGIKHIEFTKIKLGVPFGVWWTLSVFITYEERAISSGWNVNGWKWTNMISVYQGDETENAQRDGWESSSRASNWWSRLSSPLQEGRGEKRPRNDNPATHSTLTEH